MKRPRRCHPVLAVSLITFLLLTGAFGAAAAQEGLVLSEPTTTSPKGVAPGPISETPKSVLPEADVVLPLATGSTRTPPVSPEPELIPVDPVTSGTGTDLNELTIEELMEIEVDTVVSASRYRQKVSEAPASITIITAEEIRKFGYRTLADILRGVRGLYTTYDRNYHHLGIRGFGRLGDENTRILLLVDGHRLNDAIHDSAAIGTEFPIDVDLIERVEITRGPGSSLYGSNAFFGVVNVVTRTAADLGGAELSAEAGSYGTYKARLSYGAAGRQERAFLASLSGYTSDGDNHYFRVFDPSYPFADLSRATNGGRADGGDYDRVRSGYARYEHGGWQLSSAYLERTKGVPTAYHGTDFNEPGNRTVDTRGYLDIQYSGRTQGATDYTVRAYYDQYQFEGDHLYYRSGFGLNQDQAKAAWYGAEARFTRRFLEAHRVIAGFEYENRVHLDQRNADVTVAPAVFLDDRRSASSWAAYIQDEIAVSPVFLIYAGIRHDHVTTFGRTTNPRVAAVITPVENGALKLLYGSAFRAPTVYELYYEAPPSIVSNPALRPEEIDTYELVYEQTFEGGVRASISRYSYYIKNLITHTIDSAYNTVFLNIDKVESTGTELELRKTWSSGLDGRLSYAIQRTLDPNTGSLLANAPEHLAKLNVAVPFFQGRIWLGFEEQYTGSRFTAAAQKVPGYAVTNLTVLTRNRQRTLDVSLSVYNLLDKAYADPVSVDLTPLDTVAQDGRAYRVKVAYAF